MSKEKSKEKKKKSKEGGCCACCQCQCKKCCRSFMWFIFLVCVAWWLSLAAATIYCCIAPYAACYEKPKNCTTVLVKVIQAPYYVTTFMMGGKSIKQAAVSYVVYA
ncbi:hypothetical protein GBAR_LOCUS10071 [Geodia barretti]|uniref:Uncharacterized protein n=1 Tax=Geodia barretti TaxID=519541 RepID=A0AA35RSC5_GEOBA|nr:hypothetical protein GBAR_LOCUS10071 [Geodia barretti]